MSSFFTLPASQRKRKRPQPSDRPTDKGRATSKGRRERDDSISGSDASGDDAPAARGAEYEGSDDEDEEDEDEDPAAKRIRLAEQYLANTEKEVLQDGLFDAAEVDVENLRRRMGDRLKEDTAESRGKVYRSIAAELGWSGAEHKIAKTDGKSLTGVAMQGEYVYTTSHDGAITKWQIPAKPTPSSGEGKQEERVSSKLKRVLYTRGQPKQKKDYSFQHHTAAILCIAASQDGKFVVTGGKDKKLIVWDANTLKPLKVFTQHRDAVTSLAFRRGTNQLYTASKDRTVKIWSLDELAYVETLFGHQDEVVDVSALAQEKCVTVGARDRTARLWKVVEESQLVFRGGGAPSKPKRREAKAEDSGIDVPAIDDRAYNEGSMDRVACIDDDTFITGSDNGSLSIWNIHKKKPVFTYPLSHGVEPPLPLEEVSAEQDPAPKILGEPQPRWVTALRAIPFSDTFVTGSWDGYVRAWCLSPDKRRIEPLGAVGCVEESLHKLLEDEGLSSDSLSNGALQAMEDGKAKQGRVPGIINDLAIVDRGERGKDGVLIAAVVGKEHRLGRWRVMKEGKASVVLFSVARKVEEHSESEPEGTKEDVRNGDEEDFAGFD